MMVFVLRHNVPAILSAQPTNPIASVAFAPLPVPPIPNAQAGHRIVAPDHVFNAPQILNAPPPHLTATAVFAALLNPALSTPTAPAQFLIVTAALAQPQNLAHLIPIALRATDPIVSLDSVATCCIQEVSELHRVAAVASLR